MCVRMELSRPAGKHTETLLKYRGILRIFALSRIPRYYHAMEMEGKAKRENMEKKTLRFKPHPRNRVIRAFRLNNPETCSNDSTREQTRCEHRVFLCALD